MTLNVYLDGNIATQEVTIASELFPNKFKILIVPYIPSALYSKDKNNCKNFQLFSVIVGGNVCIVILRLLCVRLKHE